MSKILKSVGGAGAWLAALTLLLPVAAQAALEKFELRRSGLRTTASSSPTIDYTPNRDVNGVAPFGPALIDLSGPLPVVRFESPADLTMTIDVPGLSGFVFVSRNFTEGPSSPHTGVSGSTNDQIDWGTVTGWRYSGAHWCNSEPGSLCIVAGDNDEGTNPSPAAPSPFYDIGTWYFHGTGFTSEGFVWTRFTLNNFPGSNVTYIFRGAVDQDGTVPALPLAAALLLGLSVVAAGALAVRRS